MTAKTNNTIKKRQMQNSLYQFARKPYHTFPNLYGKIYRPYILKEAWVQTKTKSTNPSDDKTLLKAEAYGIEKLLNELRSELQFELYCIRPLHQDAIHADILKLKNDIAQMAAKIVISPIFKAEFAANSYEFRSMREMKATVDKICKSPYYKDYYILQVQIKSCFDCINQDILMALLEKRISDHEILHLIRQWISSGSIYQKKISGSRYGIEKDLVISPLLMSIYLNALDKSWKNYQNTYGKWMRYADKIIILCNNSNNADQILKFLPTLLKRFDLELDDTKTKIDCNCFDDQAYGLNPRNLICMADAPGGEIDDKASRLSLEETASFPDEETIEQLTDSFCGYKYRFGLYAAHSNINNSDENIHYHTFTINLYIHAGSYVDDNYAIERAVQDWLAPLQGKQLSTLSLFLGKETTLEGIGNTLIDPLYALVHQLGYELIKFSIYENPIRVYSVSYKRLDSTVNVINDIFLDCIPVLLLEDDVEDMELSAPDTEAALRTAAVTKELINETMEAIKTPKQASTLKEEESWKEVALTLEDATDITSEDPKPPTPKSNAVLVLFKCILGLCCFAALAILTMYIVKDSGRYPQGSDTFCHLYRADLLLKNIELGNWFPLYDGTWYNGVEIMRYWGPLPLYLLAGLEWFIQSSILDTYILFLGVLLVIGGCGWLLWGITYQRIGLSVFIGLIWFYMPENMRVVILEGNLPRGVINALLPFFFYFLWRVMVEKKRNAIFALVFITALITLCHLGITLMLIATTIIFILIHTSLNHVPRSSLCALGACISGVFLAGLWVVPALIGGAASGSSTNQVMKFFFESAFVSLNPFTRINGDMLSFYFGLSIFLLCILGTLCGPKNSKAGFITAMILLICTTKSAYELFAKLPFSQFLWMIRFIPIGLATAMVSLLLWKQLKKWATLLLAILLVADCSTSYQNIYFPSEYRIADVPANLDKRAEEALITKAKDITKQRMALMDLSEYGSFAPFYITGVGKVVNFAYGAGWEGAATASNIVNLNASAEYGWYVYLFDRALELGNDTILVPIDNLKEKSKDIERLIEAARISGYYPIENDGTSILLHKDTVEQFGVISHYQAIAIGESASGIAMIFPCFEEGSKTNINEYSFEELSTYHTIYLSGFTYDGKTTAEELLSKLADNGVNIYIDMNRIPIDEIKKSMELFGVTSQSISFSDTFPEFSYQGNTYTSLDFSYGLGEWNSVYLLGLDEVEGSCNMTNKVLPFLGTAKNENLHFIGLNIMYYLQTTRDTEIQKLAETIFGLKDSSVPAREVVPISIKKSNHQITIESEYDNVNTTLSYIDIFHSNQVIHTVNNLISVSSGTTVINMRYPYVQKGLAITAIGIILALLSFISMRSRKGCIHLEKSNENI